MNWNIYLIDDLDDRFLVFQEVLEMLNILGAERGLSFSAPWLDSFSSECPGNIAQTVVNMEYLQRALTDPWGILLVDVQLPEDLGYGKMATLLFDQQLTQPEREHAKHLFTTVFQNNYDKWLATVLFAVCAKRNLRSLITSTQATIGEIDLLKPTGIKDVLFPDSGVENACRSFAHSILRLVDMDYTGFILEMERLSHPDIDHGLANELLQSYLKLDAPGFLEHFGNAGRPLTDQDALKPKVKNALKSIGGIPYHTGEPEPLSLYGAWFLALGQFRSHFPDENWMEVFKDGVAEGPSDAGRVPRIDAFKKHVETRREGLLLFCRMFSELCQRRGSTRESTLVRAEVSDDSLSLVFGFSGNKLSENVVVFAKKARGDDAATPSGRSAQLIHQFWVSRGFCDSLGVSADDTHGLFDEQTAHMNVFRPARDLTEVRFYVPG